MDQEVAITPFLKWAGGKRWLLSAEPQLFPTHFENYIEPFLGSGAAFFHLQPASAILSDRNRRLIDTYRAIKEDWQKVYCALRKHSRNHSKEYYYEVRNSNPRKLHTKAAQFIYLNRTCWNGLYRVNLQGRFNVPVGTKMNVLLDTDDFSQVSALLQNAELIDGDFEAVIDRARSGDLVFADPPYTVKHNLNGFIKYNEQLFSWGDQLRLRDALHRAQARGVKIIATNADHRSVRDLYRSNFQFRSIERSSVIAGAVRHRGTIHELIITGNIG